jgi:uncharacterized membrane protein YkvA (DUF1232 family)
MANEPVEHPLEQHYSEPGFWTKLKDFALAAGAAVVEKALALYYCALDAETPTWARGIIYGALGYFILPIDAIPDTIPVIGFTDDLGVLVAAIGAVAAHMKPRHTEQAKATMARWFS